MDKTSNLIMLGSQTVIKYLQLNRPEQQIHMNELWKRFNFINSGQIIFYFYIRSIKMLLCIKF